MDRLRIITLNIWHRECDWEGRREIIRRGLTQLKPDIIGLQEVLRLRSDTTVKDQSLEIAEGLGYHTAYGAARPIGEHLDFGNALLSKHPILSSEVVQLPGKETGETRSVLYARIDTPVGEVPVFVTHLNWKLHQGSVRLRQVQALARLVQDRAPIGETYPPILLGDFNAEPPSDEIRFLRGFASVEGRSVFFADAWTYASAEGPGYTFDRRNPQAARAHEPPRRIDYIFVRGPDKQLRGEPLHARVIFDEPEGHLYASDHFGLYTELSVGNTPT